MIKIKEEVSGNLLREHVMKKHYTSMRYILFIMFVNATFATEWTWVHRKFFSQQEKTAKNCIVYEKKNQPHFTQLLFSWNAIRPLKGYFVFEVQVRDAQTKKWTPWYKMIEWGCCGIQRSFKSEAHAGIQYIHVRLETGSHFADAFRIKIKPADHASMANVASISVALSNFTLFLSEDSTGYATAPSIKVEGVPTFSQFLLDHPRNAALCSPTSSAMVSSYLLNRIIDPLEFAEGSYDYGLEAYGSWPFNTAHMYEVSRGLISSYVCRLPSFNHLYQYLKKGQPVIVSVRGPLPGSATPYANGHLLVVVGWDAKTQEVICHDPAFDSSNAVLKRYPLAQFLISWERSHRLAYISERRK